MTEPDHIDEFFRELGSRGHDPLLDRLEGTGRFEVCEGGRMEQWLVSVKGGYVAVSRGGGDADWVMRAEREAFSRIISGETSALAAFVRGALVVSILDLLGIAQASLADPNWVGMNMEAYAFSGAIYWLICFALSRWSRSLEKKRRL